MLQVLSVAKQPLLNTEATQAGRPRFPNIPKLGQCLGGALGGNRKEALKLWDVASYQELLTLEAEGSGYSRTAFSSDGNVIGSMNRQGPPVARGILGRNRRSGSEKMK